MFDLAQTPDPTPHYRAIMHEQDAVLKAPTGEHIAIFTHFEDAVFAAEAINTAADNADTLGQVASRLERWLANDELPTPRSATRLLTTVNTAPARHVIKPGHQRAIAARDVLLLAAAGLASDATGTN